VPLSSILLDIDEDSESMDIKSKKMNKDFLVVDCTGKNDSIALKVNNKFFIKKLQTKLVKNETLVLEIVNFTKKHSVVLNCDTSIFVNVGPGSFSGIRISLAVAKGIQLVKNTEIYSYNNFILNVAPFLKEKQNIVSVQKTNNFYYFCKGVFSAGYHFTTPEKIDSDKLQNEESLIVVPTEIKNDEIIKKLNSKKLKILDFDLKNIDLLIQNNLVENKLIKPLYLS